MIKKFTHKGLQGLFETGSTKGVNAQLADKPRRMLLRLHDGPLSDAMMPPGYRLHALQGDRKTDLHKRSAEGREEKRAQPLPCRGEVPVRFFVIEDAC